MNGTIEAGYGVAPLKKELHERAKALGVTAITLSFSGGSDEGFLYVDIKSPHKLHFYPSEIATEEQKETAEKIRSLANDVDSWAWEAYNYSGAGDGTEYGDNITYDLEKGVVVTNEWSMQRHDGEPEEGKLEIS